MKKTFLKTITVLLLTIFITSCEKDNNLDEAIEGGSKDVSVENFTINTDNSVKMTSDLWKIEKYEGSYTEMNGEKLPHIGTHLIASSKYIGDIVEHRWKAGGCFKIVEGHQDRTARILRTCNEKGWVEYTSPIPFVETEILRRKFKEIPCPIRSHTIIRRNGNRIDAQNYDQKFRYDWKVVYRMGNREQIYRKTGRFFDFPHPGRFEATLTVSLKNYCAKSDGTKIFEARH